MSLWDSDKTIPRVPNAPPGLATAGELCPLDGFCF